MASLSTRPLEGARLLSEEILGDIEVALRVTRRWLLLRRRGLGAVYPLPLRAGLILVIGAFILEDCVGVAAALA